MATSAGHRHPECELLNFSHDGKNIADLTVLVNSVRFNVVADGKAWKKAQGKAASLAQEYQKLLAAVKHEDDLRYTKPCSKENLRSGSQDSAQGSSTDDNSTSLSDSDSAVDVQDPKPGKAALLVDSQDDPDLALRCWMLQPFGKIFDKQAPKSDKQTGLSVEKWYDRPTMFYSLNIENGQLSAEEKPSSEKLEKKMSDMIPRLYAPKWMRDLDVPWCPADGLIVQHESNEPEPYHPIVVKHGSDTLFLKMVDPSQSSPTKREAKLLREIEKKRLHKKFNVPQLKGLVGFNNSRTEIMGFLLTAIDDPTPLTKYLDGDIPQEKRDSFGAEVQRIIDILHENDIVFGDCKSDNFLVDKHEKLWIIDFGGSYTDGWVDPDLMETEEGDDMGVDRIVNALHDPEANTWDPEQDKTLPFAPASDKGIASPTQAKSSIDRKRKVDQHTVDEDDETSDNQRSKDRKRQRNDESADKDENKIEEAVTSKQQSQDQDRDVSQTATEQVEEQDTDAERGDCYCGKPSSGDMIGCDGQDCERQWFHFECVGLKISPEADKWYCPDCRK